MGIAVYYEIISGDNKEYFCRKFPSLNANLQGQNRSLLWNSNRVWKEEDGADVVYLKNRTSNTIVDLKEFFWIKLQSK
jgi:hypothetical protein